MSPGETITIVSPGSECAMSANMGKATFYRVNWFRNQRLIGTEPSHGLTLDDMKKRARAIVADESADRVEICKPSGELVFQHSGTPRRG